MRQTKHIPFLLALVLLASVTLAQSKDGQGADSAPGEKAISEARSQYINTADISPADSKTLSQVPGRGPAMPFPRQSGYPRGTYGTPWMDHGSAGHVLVGAAIGFGLGALVGVKANKDPHPGATGAAVVIFGGFGALMGGLIGGSHPLLHAHRGSRPSGLGEPEESDLRAGSTPQKRGQGRPPANPALPDAVDGETSALRRLEPAAVTPEETGTLSAPGASH